MGGTQCTVEVFNGALKQAEAAVAEIEEGQKLCTLAFLAYKINHLEYAGAAGPTTMIRCLHRVCCEKRNTLQSRSSE
jgi:hypothetical protein